MRTLAQERARASSAPGSPVLERARWQPPVWLVPLALGLVLAAGIAWRFVARSELWLGEALTDNIADLPVGAIPDALRRDGAPPLFYVLLHYWLDVFGDSNTAVRALSGVIGIITLPAAWYAGRRLGGRTVAWAATLLVATSPFALRYSTEARPYGLQILLVLVGYLALRRALERPSLGRLALVAVVTALLLYCAYWSLYLLAAVGVVLLYQSWRGVADRGTARRALAAVVVGSLTFVAWLPIFWFQLEHTGTPWADPVSPPTAFARGIIEFGGGFHPEGWPLTLGLVLLALLGLFARAVDRRHIDLDLRTRRGARAEALVGLGTLVLAVTTAFATGSGAESRYAAVVLPLFLLVAAFGLLAFGDRRLRAAVLAVAVAIGLAGGLRNSFSRSRTQAGEAAAAIVAEAVPGDVVGFCPDQLGPAVDRLLPADLEGLSFPDGGDPAFVDWRDYAERNEAASPEAYASLLLDAAGDDHTVWLVWAGGYRTFGFACEGVVNALTAARPGSQLVVEGDNGFFEFANVHRFPAA